MKPRETTEASSRSQILAAQRNLHLYQPCRERQLSGDTSATKQEAIEVAGYRSRSLAKAVLERERERAFGGYSSGRLYK